jgi:lipoprotein
MKRKWIKFISIMLLFILFLSVSSCDNKERTAKGYGLVHGDYVGIATMTTKRARVRALSFEEVFLPTHWAELSDTDIDESLSITYINSRGKEVKVARYLVVGDKHFTGKLSNDGKTVLYSSNDIADIKQYVIDKEENAKWYAEELLAKRAYVANSDFTKANVKFVGESGFTKTEAGYWPETYGGLGWKKNMEKLCESFLGTKMNQNSAKFVRDDSSGVWKFDKIQSEATLVDALDYYEVAKRAYNNSLNS